MDNDQKLLSLYERIQKLELKSARLEQRVVVLEDTNSKQFKVLSNLICGLQAQLGLIETEELLVEMNS